MDTTDRCEQGHQLAPGSHPITLKNIDPESGRLLEEQTLLLRKHVPEGAISTFDPTGLSPAECDHGLPAHPDEKVQGDAVLGRLAISWIRSKHLQTRKGMGVVCPVCLGLPRPDDLTEPRNATAV